MENRSLSTQPHSVPRLICGYCDSRYELTNNFCTSCGKPNTLHPALRVRGTSRIATPSKAETSPTEPDEASRSRWNLILVATVLILSALLSSAITLRIVRARNRPGPVQQLQPGAEGWPGTLDYTYMYSDHERNGHPVALAAIDEGSFDELLQTLVPERGLHGKNPDITKSDLSPSRQYQEAIDEFEAMSDAERKARLGPLLTAGRVVLLPGGTKILVPYPAPYWRTPYPVFKVRILEGPYVGRTFLVDRGFVADSEAD